MTITRSYGSWVRATGSSAFTLDGEVADALLAGVDFNDYSDEQIAAVAGAYRDAINQALPEGVSLCGDEFYGPADADTPDLSEIVDSVDFWAVAEAVLTA